MKNFVFAVGVVALLIGGRFASASQDKGAAPAPAKQEAGPNEAERAILDSQLPSYPLTTCPISGEALDKDAVNAFANGRLVRVCCKKCAGAVGRDASAALKAIDAGVIAQQKPKYPLTTCPLSGEPLGADAVDVVVGTKLVRTCCAKCKAGVEKAPAESMAKVDAGWIEAGKKTYTLTTCPVSGEKLGGMGEPVDYLYGTHLVRFCCSGCVKGFKKDPAPILAKIDAARSTK